MAFGLADDFQPHGVIVVFLDVGNLDITHNFTVVHYRKAAGPAIVVHAGLADMGGATHGHPESRSGFIDFRIFGVGEIVAVFFHEADLFLQLVGCPQVVAIQKGYVLAAGFAEGSVAADGGTAVLFVLKDSDARC